MLRKIRISLAVVAFIGITLLFLDFTGTLHAWLGWLAKIQLLPAVLAVNVAVVVGLVVLTLLFGRIYCSVICPMGVMQDIVSWLGGKHRKNRFSYSPARRWLRYGVLALFVVLMLAGVSAVATLVAPYSAYGRIASNLLAPLYALCNNALAYLAERADSYAFYSVEVWLRSWITFDVAVVTLVVVGVLAWRGGRTYCNTICPVGTVLGMLSRFSLLRPVVDTSKCNSCGLCARNCKSACINSAEHTIDYSRCVVCGDCIDKCRKGAISYRPRHRHATNASVEKTATDRSRRSFLSLAALLAVGAARSQTHARVDGGLAVIEDKKVHARQTPLVPAGAASASNLHNHCTACGLCIAECPNGVLRPSSKLSTLMQPEMSYERGYCRAECTRCSEVCPTGAIRRIDRAEKSSTQIGHAVWIPENCIVNTDSVSCGNCSRHCPSGAITMVARDAADPASPQIPVVNTSRCIGCGACENLCPARPFSAIYVEGHQVHKTI